MFEELGFYQVRDDDYWVFYKHEKECPDITFYKEYKNCLIDGYDYGVYVDPKLALAIVQQMKELGWIE